MAERIETGTTSLAHRPVGKDKRTSRRVLVFVAVSVINVGLLALIIVALLTPKSHPDADPLVGHPAPNFSLSLLLASNKTGTLSLSQYRGKPVVLNFWGSWCAPCQEEAPLLEQRWQQTQAQGKDVVFLGIDFQDARNNGIGFLQQNHITYPSVLDVSGSVGISYRITSLPQTFFVNRQGVIVSKVAQELTSQTLTSNLQAIL